VSQAQVDVIRHDTSGKGEREALTMPPGRRS
jgi:hypothetical protein